MKNSICKVPEKSIGLINETFYCKLSQIPCEDRTERTILRALLSEGRPGKDVNKHADKTGTWDPVYLFVMRILLRSSKYNLVIFLESSKAFLLSSSFLTFALVHYILKIDIWLPVLFSNHKIVSTVIYISNSFPKIWPHLHMSQSL